jgi:uncharacterized protein DUF4333
MLTLITRPVGLGVAALACAVLAACGGGSDVVDTAKVGKDIQDTITRNSGGAVKVDSVDCPKDPAATVGKTYVCTFTLTDGSSGEVTIEVRGEDGAVRWDVSRPAGGQAERVVARGYEEKTGKKVKSVTCPDQLQAGGKVTLCDMELQNGTKGKAAVTVTSTGGIHWATK